MRVRAQWAHACQPDHGREVRVDDFADAGLAAGAVRVEEPHPVCELTEREPGLLLVEIRMVVAEPAGLGELIPARQTITKPMP